MARPNYLDFSVDELFPPTFTTPKPFLPHAFVSDGLSMKCVICGVTDSIKEADKDRNPNTNRVAAHKRHDVDGFEAHMFQFDPNLQDARKKDECRHCGRRKDHANHQDFTGRLAEWEKEKAAFDQEVMERQRRRVARDRDARLRDEKFAVLDERRTMSIIGSITSVIALLGGIGIGTWLF